VAIPKDEADPRVEIGVHVQEVILRPPGIYYDPEVTEAGVLVDAGGTDGTCSGYSQCGHVVLSIRDAIVLPSDAGLDAGDVCDAGADTGAVAQACSAQDVFNNWGAGPVIPLLLGKLAHHYGAFVVTAEVLDDSDQPIMHSGTRTPAWDSIVLYITDVCP
jgi:hypothetical protein